MTPFPRNISRSFLHANNRYIHLLITILMIVTLLLCRQIFVSHQSNNLLTDNQLQFIQICVRSELRKNATSKYTQIAHAQMGCW